MQVSSLVQQQDWNVLEQLRSSIGGGTQVGSGSGSVGEKHAGARIIPYGSDLLGGSGGGGGGGGSGTFRVSSKRARNASSTPAPTPVLYPTPYPHLPPLNPKIFPIDQPPVNKRQRTMSEETASPASTSPAGTPSKFFSCSFLLLFPFHPCPSTL
jgi:hypothetical protein